MSFLEYSSEDAPDPLLVLDLMDAFRRSKTMFVAVSLGIFDLLGETPEDARNLAGRIKVKEDALERLLDACVGLGFLRRVERRYSLQPVAENYLRRSSPRSLVGYILYSNKALYPMWGHLDDALREGSNRWHQTFGLHGSIFEKFFNTDESRREFIAGMHGLGQISSPKIVAAFDLGQFQRLVDLGGATGHLAVAACQRYPQLRATIFDLAPVVQLANMYVSRSHVADRLELIAGDFFSDPLPKGDLYSIAKILHDWSEEKLRVLLRKIYTALPDRGALLIAESLLDENKDGPLSALMQSLNMLICTEGKERSLPEYATLLHEVGFAKVEGHKTGAPLDAILAVKR